MKNNQDKGKGKGKQKENSSYEKNREENFSTIEDQEETTLKEFEDQFLALEIENSNRERLARQEMVVGPSRNLTRDSTRRILGNVTEGNLAKILKGIKEKDSSKEKVVSEEKAVSEKETNSSTSNRTGSWKFSTNYGSSKGTKATSYDNPRNVPIPGITLEGRDSNSSSLQRSHSRQSDRSDPSQKRWSLQSAHTALSDGPFLFDMEDESVEDEKEDSCHQEEPTFDPTQ